MNPSQVILITGSSNGFGRLSAETLARQGHTVFASLRDSAGRNAPKRDQLQNLATQQNLALHVIDLDVTDDASVERAVAQVIDQAGRIDVLVNNAGVMYGGVTEGYSLEQVRAQMEVNFFGVVRLNRAVLPHMRRAGRGLLLHVSSLAGGLVFPFFGLYCASKAALEALAESYYYELASLGIDSIIVEPGPFQTSLLTSQDEPQDSERVAQYGHVADLAAKMVGGLEHAVERQELQEPQAVADLIADLIAKPAGTRPLRTIAGVTDFGLAPLNPAKQQAQRVLLEAWGLTQLVPSSSSR